MVLGMGLVMRVSVVLAAALVTWGGDSAMVAFWDGLQDLLVDCKCHGTAWYSMDDCGLPLG